MIEEWNYRTAAAGYGCCEGVKEVVRAKGFSGPFEILPLGLDPELFEFRHRTAVAGRAAVIGFVGRIVKEKGVFTLLSAFEDVVKHVDARLVFIGSGPDEDHLKKKSDEAGIADKVDFRGALPHSHVPAAMRDFDVIVVPSETTPTWKEQFGRVIPEAFSMGLPVIGSNSGSIPEVIGDAGLIFVEKDSMQLSSLMRNMISDPELIPEMSRKGRSRAMEMFSWKKLAEMNRDLFHSVLAN